MECAACSFDNPENSRFCGSCGATLSTNRICPDCGAQVPAYFKFCNGCGSPLGQEQLGNSNFKIRNREAPRSYTPKHLAEKILKSRSTLEGERKQVTVLFADVKGSMELAEQVDAEEWHAILDRFFHILTDGVHRFEGTVNQYTGDGIMALFGAPIAHEDHAQRACYAALHLKGALRAYADELRRTKGLSFSTRIGINSGEVVVGKIGDDLRMDYTAQGHTVGLAQRMEALAEPGCAYLTRSTARLVEGYFELRPLGEFTVKGVTEAVAVHALEGVGPQRTRLDRSRARGFSEFVGRKEEVATLEAALERVIAGNGQAVGVVADAGVGKSRLCYEFAGRCRAKGIVVHEAHAVAHGTTVPLLPVLELVRAIFEVTESDSDQTARSKIAGRMLLLDESLRDAVPLMLEFLGVPDPALPAPAPDPEARQRQLFAVLKQLTQARSRREPAIFFFEDLHWLDAASEAFLENLVDALPGTRTLLLVNFRPEYPASCLQRSYYQQLPLAPLGPEATAQLLQGLLGRDPSLEGLVGRIAERTAGNPFFIEEVVLSLVGAGSLQGSRGAYRLVHPVDQVTVPATVQAVLAARIDRLSERDKQVLQTAAVIGKKFTEPILRQVVGTVREPPLADVELAAALRALTGAELLYEEALFPEAEFAFKHPLTQEVAYRSQLGVRRVHVAVARAIEGSMPDKLDEQAALIAHHWEEADEPLHAARWRWRAARWAGMRHSAEALRHMRKVLDLLDGQPETPETIELGIEVRGQLLTFGFRLGGMEEDLPRLLDQGRELATRSRNPRTQFHFQRGAGSYRLQGGRVAESIAPLEDAVRLADQLEDDNLRAGARYFLSIGRMYVGPLAEALRVTDEFVEILERDPRAGAEMTAFDPQVSAIAFRGMYLTMLGRAVEGEGAMARAIEMAREQGDSATRVLAADLGAWVSHFTGDLQQALVRVRRIAELAEQIGTPTVLGLGYLGLGQTLLGNERWEEALHALEQVKDRGAPFQSLVQMAPRSLALLGCGRSDEACAAAQEAVETLVKSGSTVFEGEARLVLATVLLRVGGAENSERVTAELAQAETLLQRTGYLLLRPSVHRIRAELAQLLGDDATWRDQLRQAQFLFGEMGATGHAERLAKELESPAAGAGGRRSADRGLRKKIGRQSRQKREGRESRVESQQPKGKREK